MSQVDAGFPQSLGLLARGAQRDALVASADHAQPAGFEFTRNADTQTFAGYNPSKMSARAQLLLSDRILGAIFSPVGEVRRCSRERR